MNAKDRTNAQRANYEPAFLEETFIVPLLRRSIEKILSDLPSSGEEAGRVLDVGCGRQPFRSKLESLGYRYTGMDIQQNVDESVGFVCAIDQDLPDGLTEMGCFDLIICSEVLEHVADWDCSFSNFVKLLARGGRLVISCPFLFQPHEEPFDYWRPTAHAIKLFGEKHGLRVLSCETSGDGWDVLGTVLACCHAVPARDSLIAAAIVLPLKVFRRLAIRALASSILRRCVQLRSTLYLANIAVLSRE